jgi:hypothetical protein
MRWISPNGAINTKIRTNIGGLCMQNYLNGFNFMGVRILRYHVVETQRASPPDDVLTHPHPHARTEHPLALFHDGICVALG